MIKEWLNYLWVFAFSFFHSNSPRQIMGISNRSEEDTSSENKLSFAQTSKDTNSEKMALVQAGDTTVREEEIEQTTETTLSEKTKDLGDTQMMEKSASFHGEQTSKVVEETGSSTQNVECDAKDQPENTSQKPLQEHSQQQLSNIYKPLEPIKKFEPLQPFAPLNQFETPKSFELAKQIEANIQLEALNKNVQELTDTKPVSKKNVTDAYNTESAQSNEKVDNVIVNGQKSFQPIKPLELPERMNINNQYEPLKPFDANSSSSIEKIPKDDKDTSEVEDLCPSQLNSTENKETTSNNTIQLISSEAQPVQSSLETSSLMQPSTEPLIEPFEMRTSTGELYVPVVALEPLNLDDYLKPIVVDINHNLQAEIKENKIKESLKEIISDLDTYAEKDKELKESLQSVEQKEKNSDKVEKQKFEIQKQIAQELNKIVQNNDNEQDENSEPKPSISLEKLFTPAEDAPQILPCSNRKMYTSSSFYAKGLHPTMEEQVQLAKRISNSLSDISNKASKGQSMYVNRKKRSVKWVHEGEGQDPSNQNGVPTENCGKKSPLKLLMNPHGQVQDITTLRKQGFDFETALSPDVCLEIVKDLNSPKGKGAELFAKRRKRSEKWVVGETNGTKQQDNLPDISPSPLPLHTPLPPIQVTLPTPGYIPETTQRMQHNQKLNEIQERFTRPKVKLIKSPWDAALETGSVDAAFENVPPVWPTKGAYVAPVVDSYEQALKNDVLSQWRASPANGYGDKVYAHNPAYNSSSINRIVDNLQKGVSSVDVYKPKFPQAWNSKPVNYQQYSSNTLPKSKSKAPASPSFKASTATPPVFIPKESSTAVSSYVSQPITQTNYSPQDTFTYIPESTTPKINFNNLQNYNTAPRGWGQIKDVYRPITFDKPKSSYSDY